MSIAPKDTWVIETRKEAATRGVSKYYTGRPCTNGHESQRYTSSGICCKCNTENTMRYQRNMVSRLNGKTVDVRVVLYVPEDQVDALQAYAEILRGGAA